MQETEAHQEQQPIQSVKILKGWGEFTYVPISRIATVSECKDVKNMCEIKEIDGTVYYAGISAKGFVTRSLGWEILPEFRQQIRRTKAPLWYRLRRILLFWK